MKKIIILTIVSILFTGCAMYRQSSPEQIVSKVENFCARDAGFKRGTPAYADCKIKMLDRAIRYQQMEQTQGVYQSQNNPVARFARNIRNNNALANQSRAIRPINTNCDTTYYGGIQSTNCRSY